MSERKSSKKRRGRNRSGGESSGAKGSKPRRREPKVDPTEFWGEPDALPEPPDQLMTAPDVKALVSSLGRPPITGQETAAEHWFSLVYERAAVLAGALAVAGGLDQPEEAEPGTG